MPNNVDGAITPRAETGAKRYNKDAIATSADRDALGQSPSSLPGGLSHFALEGCNALFPPQLIGRFFFFNPSCCSMYGSPFVIQSGAGSPFR